MDTLSLYIGLGIATLALGCIMLSELEVKKSHACTLMRYASELDYAIETVRLERNRISNDPSVSPLEQRMVKAQLEVAITVLMKARDKYAAEAVASWLMLITEVRESFVGPGVVEDIKKLSPTAPMGYKP